MKKLIFPILTILLFFLILEQVSSQENINVGLFQENNFFEIDKEGSISGFYYEYLKKIKDYAEWDYTFLRDSHSGVLESLKTKKIDLVCGFAITKERKNDFIYTDIPISIIIPTLIASKEIPLYYNDLDEINEYTIGAIDTAVSFELYKKFFREHNVEVEYTLFNTEEDLLTAFNEGKVKLAIVRGTSVPSNAKTIRRLPNVEVFFMFNKENVVLRDKFEHAISHLHVDYPYLKSELTQKWIPIEKYILKDFTREEHNLIQSLKSLEVYVPLNHYPLSYFTNKNGEIDKNGTSWNGYYAQIWKKIEKSTGISMIYLHEPKDLISLSQQSIHPHVIGLYLETKRFNIKYNILAGKEYSLEKYLLLQNKKNTLPLRDLQDLKKASINIGITEGHPSLDFFIQEKIPLSIVESFESIPKLLMALQNKKIDCILIEPSCLRAQYIATNYRDINPFAEIYFDIPVTFGIVNNYPEAEKLANIINKAMRRINQDEKNILLSQTQLELTPSISFSVFLQQYKIIILSIIGFLSLLLFFLLFYLQHKKLKRASVDSLTQLWTMDKFYHETTKKIAENPTKKYAVIFVDIIDFKFINTIYGHEKGDGILKHYAHQLKNMLQKTAFYCRGYADHFFICLEIPDEYTAYTTAKKLINTGFTATDFRALHITMKSGIAIKPPSQEKTKDLKTIKELIEKSILAKARIETNDERHISIYSKELELQSMHKHAIESKMEKALEKKEFVVFYQPKYNLTTKKIVGAEALVRWDDPDTGIVQPGMFIPIFERNGFIQKLDFYVYERVFSHIQKWQKEGLPLSRISVNMSRAHFTTNDFPSRFHRLFRLFDLDPSLIEIEMTESGFTSQEYKARSFTEELRAYGFHVSMDDFGTGYATFAMLKKSPFDVIKIDKSFVDEITTSSKTRLIIANLISLANDLGISTVCEGVETAEQIELLKTTGAIIVQGYFYSKPIKEENFRKQLVEENTP